MRPRRVIAVVGTGCALAWCGPVLEHGAPGWHDGEASVGAVTWRLGWETTGTAREQHGGWRVENDLGYRVQVEAGWALRWTVQLVPCEQDAEPTAQGPSWPWRGLRVGPRQAWANHPEAPEPTRLLVAHAGDLATPAEVGFPTVAFSPVRYCAAHLAVAPTTAEARDRAPAWVGRDSLVVAGRWARGAREGRFALAARWAHGATLPLRRSAAVPDGSAVTVTLRHALARLFDGVAFDDPDQSDQERAWRVLANLVEGTRAELAPVAAP